MTVDESTTQATGQWQWIALGVLCLAALLVSLHAFVLLLAMPAVTAGLHASSAQQLWILDVYGFMAAGLMITMGTLGDRVGRRRLLLIAAAVFGVASIVAAYSVTPEMLIGARAVLGVAGSAIVPCALSLISTLFSGERQRTIALGIWGSCFTVGAVVGPVLGGVLLAHFWWGSAFLIAVPATMVLLLAGRFVLPEYRNVRIRGLDLLSVVLSMAAILPAINGMKHLASHGFGPMSAAALVTGGVFGWIFVHRQRRLQDPLVDVRLFGQRTFSVTLGSVMSYSMLTTGVMVLIAQYFQLVQGMTPLAAGVALIPGMITSMIVFQLVPLLAQRVRPGVLITAGITFTIAGFCAMALATSTIVLVVAFAVACIGAAPLQTLGMNIVISSVPLEKSGSAAALIQTSVGFGCSLGIAIPGSVVTVTYRSLMDGKGGSSLGEAITNAVSPAVLGEARHAFTTGVHLIAGISAVALAVVGILLARTLRALPAMGREQSGGLTAPGRRTTS